MAKPTDERIAAALAQGARVADVTALITDLHAEIATAEAEAKRLDDLSIAITTAEADADAAADEASKARRRVTRLTAKVAALEERVKESEASNRRKIAETNYAAAMATRDALAKELAQKWPKLTGQIVDLFERIEASDAECERIGTCYGKSKLASAEAIARGCGDNFMVQQRGMSSLQLVTRLIAMKIPALDATDHMLAYNGLWPKASRSAL